MDFQTATSQFGRDESFRRACAAGLAAVPRPKKLYDAILVDEAQDFPPEFLRLCHRVLDGHKRLVYAYDELQNLSGASMPAPEELFGLDAEGEPLVQFERSLSPTPERDIILEKCYRNSRPVLVTADGLGFGVARRPPKGKKTGLVQMFDQPDLWGDIGYRVKSGELAPGKNVVLQRTPETSPTFLESHSERGLRLGH